MVNYFIYAKDLSFSTCNNKYYHTNSLKTLEQFKRDVENIKEEQLFVEEAPSESKIVYLHWGDVCWDVDEDETKTVYDNLKCERMGTEPKCIIRHLQSKYILDDNDKIKLLYIVTDGLISNESAEKCFKLNEFMHYETVVLHALNEDPDKIDFSVAASFFKSRCMVYRNYKLCVSTDISKKFIYDKISIFNFQAKKDQLKSYITLKFINKDERDADILHEIDKLKQLKDRLSNELALEALNSEKVEFLDRDWCNKLIDTMIVMKFEIEKSISALINYIVSKAKSYSFDALTFNMEVDESKEEEQIGVVDIVCAEQEFEIFELTLDYDVEILVTNDIAKMVDTK